MSLGENTHPILFALLSASLRFTLNIQPFSKQTTNQKAVIEWHATIICLR